MSEIWFTADTHFGHKAIIDHCHRPFDSVGEMDETMIANWNSCIQPKDEVWHLGDFAYKSRPEVYADRLQGNINILVGNHDKKNTLVRVFGADNVHDVKYLRHQGLRFWLSHYGHRVWPNSHRGNLHLYGHSHGQLVNWGRSMDVGVDSIATNFFPIHIDRVVELLGDGHLTIHHDNMKGMKHGDRS